MTNLGVESQELRGQSNQARYFQRPDDKREGSETPNERSWERSSRRLDQHANNKADLSRREVKVPAAQAVDGQLAQVLAAANRTKVWRCTGTRKRRKARQRQRQGIHSHCSARTRRAEGPRPKEGVTRRSQTLAESKNKEHSGRTGSRGRASRRWGRPARPGSSCRCTEAQE